MSFETGTSNFALYTHAHTKLHTHTHTYMRDVCIVRGCTKECGENKKIFQNLVRYINQWILLWIIEKPNPHF